MKNMKTITLFSTAFILLSSVAIAQDDDKNLVQDAGFEMIEGRLKKAKQIEVSKHWKSPTLVKADLYSRSVKEIVSVPNNMQGMEEAFEGDNYAGVRMYSYNNKLPRTYVSTELLGGLKKGIQYCVSYKVSLSEKSKYATNNLSAHLSKKELKKEDKGNMFFDDEDIQVRHSKNKIFNAQYNWETICTIVTAEGGEKYLTLGNFDSDKNTKYERMKKPKAIQGAQTYDAYYYIDDVQVFQLDSVAECNCEAVDITKEDVETVYVKQIISRKELKTPELVEASTVYFGISKPELTANSKTDLDVLALRMSEESNLKLEIHGHSDKDEEAAGMKNPLLKYIAQKRVNAVVKYLESKGIDKNRFTTIVHDAKMPADSADSGIAHAKNRRVEFKVSE